MLTIDRHLSAEALAAAGAFFCAQDMGAFPYAGTGPAFWEHYLMSTAQSENVVTLPSNAYATMPAVVFKALSEFAKNTGGRPRLGFSAITGGAAWATDGHKLMRWELDGAMGTGFEPGKTYTVKPVKLPAGAERVRLEFIAGAPQPMVIAEMKNGGSATFNSEESDLNYPDIQAVYRSAFEKPSPALNENYALNAAHSLLSLSLSISIP